MTISRLGHYIVHPASDESAELAEAPAGSPVPQPLLTARCHRNLRGPYSGGGELVRAVVPDLLIDHPDLVTARSAEVIALAPELAPQVPKAPITLTQAASRDERTRYYPAARTRRLAHGIAELVLDWARIRHPGGVVIALLELDQADATDRELVSVLLTRCDPSVLTLVVESAGGSDELGHALARNAQQIRRPVPAVSIGAGELFIDSEGTTSDPTALAAYAALSPDDRARLHTVRAERLIALDAPGARLGAILFHLERGTDPAGAAEQFVAATEECFERGCYAAALDLALRARRLFGAARPKAYWNMTNKVGACMCYLAQAEESLAYFGELRRGSIDPEIHMNTAYMLAMLYTRHLPNDLRDQDLALEWVNTAIAIADRQPEPHRKAFFGAFMRNARALVELRLGDLQKVLSLLREAIALTDADLAGDEHLLHRSVLVYNRAQVYAAMGEHDAALVDYDEILRRDPNYGDYYFERAGERRAAGRFDGALADYASAIRLSPPFHEAHFNRADLLIELELAEQALPDLDYALELEPDHVDSLVNRVDLLLASGELDRARRDIEHGLSLDPVNVNLLSAQGVLYEEADDIDAAYQSYSAALAEDRSYVAAWANRAVLSYSQGRLDEAVADLTHAIEIDDRAYLRANRAIALQEMNDHHSALVDLDLAIDSFGAEDPDLLYRRGVSRHALHDGNGARADWQAHLAAYGPEAPSAHAADIERLTAEFAEAPVGVA